MSILMTSSPFSSALDVPVWIDAVAVLVGSAFGGLTAAQRKLDVVGAVGLAMLCGLGGGLIRDIIMQVGNVYMLRTPYAIPASVIAGLLAFFASSRLKNAATIMEWLDILVIGLFAASGSDKALVYGLNVWAQVFMGTMTGVGGGMLRDVFLGDVPNIFKKGNFYALCAVFGSCAYLGMVMLRLDKVLALIACLIVTVVLRRVSLRFDVLSPTDDDIRRSLHQLGRHGEKNHVVAASADDDSEGVAPTCDEAEGCELADDATAGVTEADAETSSE